MIVIYNGGPALCSRCNEIASHVQGHQKLCPKHYRFGQMRATAKRASKAVPTVAELENLCAAGMACPDCTALMNWLGRDNQEKVVTLQHYRDGSFALVCRSCNTRHAHSPNDTFRGKGGDLKFCPHCKVFKPLSAFSRDAGRSGTMKIKSWCKECSHQSHAEWRIQNRDYYNAK